MYVMSDTFICNGRIFNVYQQVDDVTHEPIPHRYRCSVTIGRKPNGSPKQKNITGTSVEIVKYRVYALFNVHYHSDLTNRLDITLLQCLNDWLKLHYKHCKAASYETEYYRINQVMGPLIEDIKLQQFSHEAAQELIYRLDDHYSGSVVCACASILRRCLDVHFARGDIRYNPCTHLWLPANKRKKEIVPFTISELRNLFTVAKPGGLDLLYLVCFYCTLRVGEAIALRWSDINFASRSITIRSSVTRGSKLLNIPAGIQNSTKGNEPRTIYVADVVLSYLQQAKKRQLLQKVKAGPAWVDSGFCFTTDFGTPHRYGAIRDHFKKCCIAIGRPDASIHLLRHTDMSMLYANGSSIAEIGEQGGHKNSITTLGYIHPTEITQQRHHEQNNMISKQIAVAAFKQTEL